MKLYDRMMLVASLRNRNKQLIFGRGFSSCVNVKNSKQRSSSETVSNSRESLDVAVTIDSRSFVSKFDNLVLNSLMSRNLEGIVGEPGYDIAIRKGGGCNQDSVIWLQASVVGCS